MRRDSICGGTYRFMVSKSECSVISVPCFCNVQISCWGTNRFSSCDRSRGRKCLDYQNETEPMDEASVTAVHILGLGCAGEAIFEAGKAKSLQRNIAVIHCHSGHVPGNHARIIVAAKLS